MKVFWATKDYSTKKVADLPGIRVSTIHSSKGFQFKAVILFGADSLPFSDDEEEIEKGEKLFYVALTRAEDFLVIVSSGKKSEFIDRILGLNDKDLISVL
jgi:superfamily I DNA/RNA helicase